MLNIKKLLVGSPVRLRYVTRYSTCRVMKVETVAEHSYFVIFYALMICKWCAMNDIIVNIEKTLTRATLHDLEEAVTGDVPRSFKYSDEGLRKHLDEIALEGLRAAISDLWDSDVVKEYIIDVWKIAKDNSLEGRIIEFADCLSVLSYVYEEVRSSNFTMREHLDSMKEYYAKFDTKDYDFLRPLIDQGKQILYEEVL